MSRQRPWTAAAHVFKWVWLSLLMAALLPATAAQAQTAIRQAGGFEIGAPTIAFCNGSPDFMPTHGTAVTAATGTSFVGFHESAGTVWGSEIFSIAIDRTLAPGTAYAFPFMARIATINVNDPFWIASNQGGNSGSFLVYAGPTPCSQTQLIGTVSLNWPADDQWLPRELAFTATGNHQYFTFMAGYNPDAANITYFGLDDAPPTDLAITKTDGSSTYTPGANVTYTITATNNGPNYASTVQISDPLPPGITTANWTCTAAGGAACGAASGVGALQAVANIPVGSAVTYTMTMAVPSTMTGPLTNIATIAPPGGGDANPGNNTAQDVDTAAPLADLAIAKVSTPNPYVPGAPLAYTVVVSNQGPSAITGASVVDNLPPQLAGFTWACTPNTSGSACGTGSGTGAINTTVDLPAGGSVTLVLSGTAPTGPVIPLSNTATVTSPPGTPDPVPGNNSSTDINPANATADLRIAKASTPTPFVPGQTLTYTIVVANDGPSDITGVRVQDPLPPAFAGFAWTCVAGPGAVCQTASGSGDIDVLVDLPSGATATFTSSGIVPSGYTGTAVNTATVTPPPGVNDPVPGNNTSTTTNTADNQTDLVITKTQTPDPYVPGSAIAYTLVVQNIGPSDAVNARVQDTLPNAITGATWTCAAAGAGASCASASGVNVIDTFVSLPAGASATFTINGTVLPGATGILSNTATVTPPLNATDPVPGNNQSTVNSGGAPTANLGIVKTATPNPYVAGTPLAYAIVVQNQGPSNATGARVQDLFPASLSGFTWTCTASAGAACGTTSGTSLIDVLVDVPVGGTVTFTVNGTVPTDVTGALTNTATITPPAGVNDPTPGDNTSSVTLGGSALADLSLTKTSSPNPYVPGAPIVYTIVASNAGPSALAGGRIRDGLPPVLQSPTWICTAINATCPAASGNGNVDALVNIAAGGSVTFEITAMVPVGTSGTLVNAATILPPAGTADPSTSNNTGTNYNPSVPILGPADLEITQEFPGVAQPNGLLTFRLVTKNLGSHRALNPYITGMIPPGTTFVSAAPGAGGICTTPDNPPPPDPVTGYPITGGTVAPLRCTWPGLMEVGESRTLEFTVRVAPATRVGQVLWSCWWTWSDTEDPYHANNVVDAYLFVDDSVMPVGDLSVTGAALSEGAIATSLPAQVGQAVPMRFWATNHGPAATRGQYALILDTANTIEILSMQLAQGWVTPTGAASAMWDTGLVQPGQTVAVDLSVRLLTPAAVEIFAQRVAGLPGDPNASNERATIVLDGYAPGMAGRWVAVGNVDGTGAGEILTATGRGETPQVRVFTGAGADTGLRFFAYERTFTGGVQIASCDVNGDGVSEVITAPGAGRAPTVRVLKVAGGITTELTSFEAFESTFSGGVSVACADLDGDGAAEIVVGAGPGRAPEVRVFSAGLGSSATLATFMAYEPGFLGGVRVAAGAYPGRTGWLDAFGIVTTPGPGRPAEARLWTAAGAGVAQVMISAADAGVIPTLGDVNGDGQLDLVIAPDNGRPELVRLYDVDTGTLLGYVEGGIAGFPAGVRIAIGTLDGGPGAPELVVGNGAGGHPRVRVIYWPASGPVQRLEILPLEMP